MISQSAAEQLSLSARGERMDGTSVHSAHKAGEGHIGQLTERAGRPDEPGKSWSVQTDELILARYVGHGMSRSHREGTTGSVDWRAFTRPALSLSQ